MNTAQNHDKTDKQLNQIFLILQEVSKVGLDAEVVYSALKEIQKNPNMSPLLAIQIAAKDWDVY